MSDKTEAPETVGVDPAAEIEDALSWLEERLEQGLNAAGAKLPGKLAAEGRGTEVADGLRSMPTVAVGAALAAGAVFGLVIRRFLP